MRGNVLQTRTPGWLMLTALLMAGGATTGRCRVGGDDARRVCASAARAEYCAALPLAATRRWAEIGRAGSPRRAAAMLLVLMAQRGRVAGLSR